jgi:NADH-quinone oxidoreductase subunit N
MLLLKIYIPELYLSLSLIALLLFNILLITRAKYRLPILNYEILFQIFSILIILFLLLFNISCYNIGFDIFFFSSIETQNLKIFLTLVILFFFILMWRSFILEALNFFEYFIILLIILIAFFFLLNSYNFISIYLCLEIQALGFYILSAFDRTSIFSSDSGLKYFISSSLISGVFLFGIILIYGTIGNLNIYNLKFLILNFFENSNNISLFFIILGLILILNTLLFKLVIAPFHFWFPQIYLGSPLISTIFFTTIPKIVLINLFIQFWSISFKILYFFNTIYFLIGIYSVFWGIFKMLKQYNLKKIYIYSSISNMGLLLCLLINNSLESTTTIYFYLVIYLITSFLLWFSLLILKINLNKILNYNYPLFITNFTNMNKQNKLFAIGICFSFFSLASIPPFCGFLSKTYIYILLLKNFKYELSIFLIYLGTFGMYYYIKFIKIIFFEHNSLKITKIHTFFNINFFNLDSMLYSLSLYFLICLGVNPNFLMYLCFLF